MADELQYDDPGFNQPPSKLNTSPLLSEEDVSIPQTPGADLPFPDVYSQSVNPAVAARQRISNISKQINPFYDRPDLKEYTVPLEQSRKFLDMGFGYVPGIDNDDFYSDTQGVFKTLGKGLLRIPTLITTKLGQTVGFLGSLPYAVATESGENIIAEAADNTFSKFFATVEDNVKNEWLRTFNSADDKEKGFFGRMFTDLDFWTDDFVDGAAFMGSAWIPGFALNKLKLGQRTMGAIGKISNKSIMNPSLKANIEAVSAGTNYFSNAQRYSSTIGKYNAWAMATTSESLFEASEIKKNVYESLGVDELGNIRINPETGQAYTEDEKKKISANAAQNGFLMNAALLSGTNLFEISYMSKIFSKTPGKASSLIGGAKIGETLSTKVPKNTWQKFMESGYGVGAKAAGLGILREGVVEENVQLAIQRFNELYGTNGVMSDMLDYTTYTGLASQAFDQTINAVRGKDPETAMSIGLGSLLGGGANVVGDLRQSKKDKLTTEEAIKYYNDTQENWLKFGNIFKTEEVDITDADGTITKQTKILLDSSNQPLVDDVKMGAVLSNNKAYMASMGLSDDVDETSPFVRNIAKDMAFAKFVDAHIKSENEDGLLQKLDALTTSSNEDLAKLGFVKNSSFQEDINRYKNLATKIIAQNKIINSDIFFDNSNEDKARKNALTNIASQQAVYRSLAGEEQSKYQELKNQLINSSNSSLGDGLVDQLNQIEFRIRSQEQLIESLQKAGITKPVYVNIHKKALENLKSLKKRLLTDNETSVKALQKDSDGLYKYEKDSRNDPSIFNTLNKRIKTIGELENHISNLGEEWGAYSDLKNGKNNFTSIFNETVVEPLNQKIEKDNKDIDEDSLVNIEDDLEEPGTVPLSALGSVESTPPPSSPSSNAPGLIPYLQERYKELKDKGQVGLSFDDWLATGGADFYIKFYNERYKTSEKPPVIKKEKEEEIPSDLLEETDDEIPDEFSGMLTSDDEESDDDLSEELGSKSFSSLKLGPYVINIGDKINDEEITFISDKIVLVGDNQMSYDEVRKSIDAFRGRNITRKGDAKDVDEDVFENGEIQDVQNTTPSTFNQKIQNVINENNSNVVFGGSDKVIQGGSKINNTSDFYNITVSTLPSGKKRIDRERTTPNTNYPMVMSTPDINVGTPIKLAADVSIKDFREQDSLDPANTKVRKASDFFDGTRVKTSAINDFPIRIDTEVNGKTVSLGYLPTLKWLEARWPDGETMNVIEFITLPSGEKVNNLEKERKKLLEIRKMILEGQNKNNKFILESIVNGKSDGQLRVSTTSKKLSQVFKPSTKLGIIRKGLIHLENDSSLDPSDVIANFGDFSGKEGWPVVLVPTPTGKVLASYVSVPKLAPQHADFIVTAWKAFHAVKDAKDLTAVKEYEDIVKAVYDATETPYSSGIVIDFNVLKSYINSYITFTSGKEYSPLLKEGTSQLNITADGILSVWVVKDKEKQKDLKMAANISEFSSKENDIVEKIKELYYNVKTTEKSTQGINSVDSKRYLSSLGGKVRVSASPMTYNEYMMSILETNIEQGRPVDSTDPNSDLVYFSNPVLTFDTVKSNEAELANEDKKKNIPPISGPIDPKIEKLRENWSLSLDAIRKSTIGDGFATTVFDSNNNFTTLSDTTEDNLVKQIEDFYMGQIENIRKPKKSASPITKESELESIKNLKNGDIVSSLADNDTIIQARVSNLKDGEFDLTPIDSSKKVKSVPGGIYSLPFLQAAIIKKYQVAVSTQMSPQLKQRRDDLSNEGISIIEQDGTFDVVHVFDGVIAERIATLEEAITIGEKAGKDTAQGLMSLAKKAAPEKDDTDLLDLDFNIGDLAEDIGSPDDGGLKSIRTSLKELKKTCD
jgi:hypothetical protein